MNGAPTRPLIIALLMGALLLPSAAVADPGRRSGADERSHIVAAQQELSRQFGGRKLNQTWRGDDLLIVWQTDNGRRLLVQVDPRHGGWRILRDENPGR